MMIVLAGIKYLCLFWLIMTIILISVKTIIFFISLIVDEVRIKKWYQKIDYVVTDFISKIGYAILINGKIGSGKTTSQALITHYLTIDCLTKVQQVIQDFKDEYNELDFTLIDLEIETLYSQYLKAMEEDPTINYHFKNLFDVLADKYCDLLSEHKYDDGVNVKSFYDGFYDYIFAYTRLKNNHYVCANTKVYSYITHNYAMGYKSNYMSLKAMYDENSLYFDNYMVIVKDENSASPDDYYLNYHKIYKDDDGKHLFLRFIRHLFKGTVRFITTDQDATGMVANQRKILDTFVYVLGLKIVCDRPTLTKLLIFLRQCSYTWEKMFCKTFVPSNKQKIYLDNNNMFKKLRKMFIKIQSNIYSRALVKYEYRIYKEADDCANLRNNTDSRSYYDSATLIGPIQWCFGSIDTHEFNYIYRYFQSHYGHNFWNLNEFKEIVSQIDLDEKTAMILDRKYDEEIEEVDEEENESKDEDLMV